MNIHTVNTERSKLTFHITGVFALMQSLENTDLVDAQTKKCFIAGSHEGGAAAVSGKWHRERRRRGIYMSSIAVCAAQTGVNLHQSRGRAPL